METNIIIYGKENCPHTKRARDAYPAAVYHDVLKEPHRLDEMLRLSEGVRKVPIIVRKGEVEVGYNRGA